MLKSKADRAANALSKISPLKERADLVCEQVARSKPWRVFSLSVRNFLRNNDPLWASALTYTTTLSIVPMLAIALSTVSVLNTAGGLHDLIVRYVAADSPDIADKILDFVSKADNRALSIFGGGALLVTTFMTLGTVEAAFNNIFRVPVARSLGRRLVEYLGVIFVVPPLIGVAIGVREGVAAFLPHWSVLGWALSGVMVWGVLSLLYSFFPHTKVRWDSALAGGLAAALLLDLARRALVHFQYGVSSYEAIYGALAAIPIFMTWTYMSWMLLLYGGELAAALQMADNAFFDADSRSQDFARAAAVLTMLRLAQRMTKRVARVGADTLAAELDVAKEALTPILRQLKNSDLIVEAQEEDSDSRQQGLFLARDPGLISLEEVIRQARAVGEVRVRAPQVQGVIRLIARGEDEIARTLTLRDLLDEGSEGNSLLQQGAPAARDAISAKSR